MGQGRSKGSKGVKMDVMGVPGVPGSAKALSQRFKGNVSGVQGDQQGR